MEGESFIESKLGEMVESPLSERQTAPPCGGARPYTTFSILQTLASGCHGCFFCGPPDRPAGYSSYTQAFGYDKRTSVLVGGELPQPWDLRTATGNINVVDAPGVWRLTFRFRVFRKINADASLPIRSWVFFNLRRYCGDAAPNEQLIRQGAQCYQEGTDFIHDTVLVDGVPADAVPTIASNPAAVNSSWKFDLSTVTPVWVNWNDRFDVFTFEVKMDVYDTLPCCDANWFLDVYEFTKDGRALGVNVPTGGSDQGNAGINAQLADPSGWAAVPIPPVFGAGRIPSTILNGPDGPEGACPGVLEPWPGSCDPAYLPNFGPDQVVTGYNFPNDIFSPGFFIWQADLVVGRITKDFIPLQATNSLVEFVSGTSYRLTLNLKNTSCHDFNGTITLQTGGPVSAGPAMVYTGQIAAGTEVVLTYLFTLSPGATVYPMVLTPFDGGHSFQPITLQIRPLITISLVTRGSNDGFCSGTPQTAVIGFRIKNSGNGPTYNLTGEVSLSVNAPLGFNVNPCNSQSTFTFSPARVPAGQTAIIAFLFNRSGVPTGGQNITVAPVDTTYVHPALFATV